MSSLTNIYFLISTLLTIFADDIRADDPRVTTGLGDIIGQLTTFAADSDVQVKEFLGVPLAKPPLGDLRFRKPVPLDPWSEPIECKTQPKACMQRRTAPYPWAMDPTEAEQHINEDCLYMNIWVPMDASPQNMKAVFLWIHGGGFFSGSVRQDIYDGRVIAGLGDVIVVTTNYRLGSFGFWSSDQETAPGNVALLDMIAALQWVHTHIEAFGGDNTHITLAGESAGSVAVGLLTLGKSHSLMIKRVIMQSSSPANTLYDIDQTPKRAMQLATRCGCANETYAIADHPGEIEACMRGIDAFKLMEEEGMINPGSPRSFRPRYGVAPLGQNPRVYLRKGDFPDVDLLAGTVSNEGGFRITTANKDLFGFFGEKDPEIDREQAKVIFKKNFGKYSFHDAVVQHYLPEGETDYKGAMSTASGDFTLVCNTVYYAEKIAEKGNRVYYYNFNHRPSNSDWAPWIGTTHYDEVQFLFGHPFLNPDRYTSEERDLTKVMIEHWSNYVKEGNPYGSGSEKAWPAYSREAPTFMWYNTTGSGVVQSEGIGPDKEHCDFFRQYWDWYPDVPDKEKITSELGEIIGQTVNFIDSSEIKVREFLGVPFANPPLGDLRFQKPVPSEPWSEPIECRTMPKACVQYTTAKVPWVMDPNKIEGNVDEDCLYMNIWVPTGASPQNKKAVFLWIHGGGFFTGSIRQEEYNGRVIAGLGDVIVVTTNYRLGSFGFWSSDQETAPGNVGLLDMMAALQWVHTHIAAFGGDNSQITLAGESAGSVAVGILTLGLDNSLLIRRVIMQSASPASSSGDIDKTPERSLQVATKCGCANESYSIVDHPREVEACMRGIDALTIIKEESSINPGWVTSFRPRYTVAPLTQNPRIYLRDGNFRLVPLLIGTVFNEGAWVITATNPDLFGFFGEKDPQITREQAEEILKKTFDKYDFYSQLVDHYLPEGETDFRQAVVDAFGDFILLCPTVYFAEKFAERDLAVYYYNFNHRPSNSKWAPWMQATHYDDVQFVFGQPFLKSDSYTPEEKELSRMMIEHWTTFTKSGAPYESGSQTTWPHYSKESPEFLWYNITGSGVEQTKGVGPHREHCDFFRNYWNWFDNESSA